jgi:DNA-binding response OmpR family regulator
MKTMTERHRILVVSHDPHLADVRKALLEAAGFEVFSASNLKAVQAACQKDLHLVMIGYSLPPAEKRRVWAEVRERCKTPVLELHKDEDPSLPAEVFFHRPERPDDFLAVVKRILTDAA